MKLYGRRLSPYVERVCLQIAYKGLGDEIVLTPIPGEDLKSPEYLAISPLGKMPLLEDGDFRLPESAVIAEYIEEKFPEKPTRKTHPAGGSNWPRPGAACGLRPWDIRNGAAVLFDWPVAGPGA